MKIYEATILTLESHIIESPMKIEALTFGSMERLHEALRADGIDFPENTSAYTDCFDDMENVGRFYFHDTSHGVLAHEATHMALHIMSLLGHETIPVVKPGELAPSVEEALCYLVGDITELLCEVI